MSNNELDSNRMLSLYGITLFAEEKVLFQNLSLALTKGDRVGILGPNGSGKTTLLRTVLGREIPKTGSISLQGHEIGQISAAERGAFFGYLPQAYEAVPPLSVVEFVRACLVQKGGDGIDLQVSLLLAKLALCEVADQLLPTLSGGELRRVFFGAALLGEPKLLILDEPLVSLDRAGRFLMTEAIEKRFSDDSEVTALIVSHDEEFLLRFCNRVYQVAHCGLQNLLDEAEESDAVEDAAKEWIQ